MHMADALLSPAVGGVMFAVSAGVVAYSAREVRRTPDDRRTPLMGVAGAFVFAAQMINFAIPGTGSSGHIGGAVLLAALLGPAPAFLAMAAVLLIQALFFADGGLLAWGGNLFNMGFFGCYLAYPLIFRPLAGKNPGPARLTAASLAACVAAMELGALAVTLETLCSGVAELPFAVFAAAMLPIHLAIGLGEGLATAAVLVFLRKNLPQSDDLKLDGVRGPGAAAIVLGLAALVIGGGLSLLASTRPDGLEWSIGKVTGTEEPAAAPGAVHAWMARLAEHCAVLPDYSFSGGESAPGTVVAGIAGAALCAGALALTGYLLCRRKRIAAQNGAAS